MDNGGMDWKSLSGVLSDTENEKSAESPRTLSRSLRKCDVDEEESWLTPDRVTAGGNLPEMVVAGDFSISREFRFTVNNNIKLFSVTMVP